jgi:hypothetical protein
LIDTKYHLGDLKQKISARMMSFEGVVVFNQAS